MMLTTNFKTLIFAVLLGLSWPVLALAQNSDYPQDYDQEDYDSETPPPEVDPGADPGADNGGDTYDEDTMLAIASTFFGESSAALAKILQKIFADYGQPTAYIEGEEGSGAAIIGMRVGKGRLTHKIEGTKKIYWIGPSIGFDLGGNISKTFALVYNLHDSEEAYQRFPGVDGSLYYIAGVSVNYQRRGNIVVAPIRVGVGLRAAANIGWVRYTRKRTWFPF